MDTMKFNFTLRNIMIVIVLTVVALLVIKLQTLVTIFAIAFFLAYLFDPLINRFEKWHVSRIISIMFLFVVIFVSCLLFVSSIVPIVYQEAVLLLEALPGYSEKIFNVLSDLAEQFGFSFSYEAIKAQIIPKLTLIVKTMLSSTDSILKSVNNIVNIVLNVALIPILTFYFLKDFSTIKNNMFDKFSNASSIDFPKHFMHFNSLLSRYFRGQVIVAIFLGVSYTLVLSLVGVKPALLLGLVSGVLSIVPYLGFIIGFSSALVLAIAQYADLLHPILIIIGFGIVQLIESYIVTPKVVGGSLGLHPTAVIFALMAGGSLMGIGGMIIALPVASFLKVVGDEYLARLNARKVKIDSRNAREIKK